MALTSDQKHYIKKNIQRFSIGEIASNLGLPNKVVENFAKKKLGKDKLKQISQNAYISKKNNLDIASGIDSFRLGNFFADNINYFLLFFILIAISYANSLSNAFVSDDVQGIALNAEVGKISYIFSSLVGFIQRSIFFLAYHIGNGTPGYFRLFNILFHLGSTFLIFIILSLISKKNVAIFAAAIFAVHPFFTESVSWISGMPYSLSALFFFLSFLFYILSSTRKKFLYYSLGAFLATMISSEKSAVLLIVFPLYELAFGNLKINWKKTAIFTILSLFFGIMSLLKIGYRLEALNTQYYANSSGLYNPLVQIPIAIANYFGLIFWPDKLSLYHTEMNFSVSIMVIFWITTLVYLFLIIWGWKKNKPLFFWLTFFFVPLIPTLTPLKIAWIVAERYAYLSAIGIIVAAAMVLDWIIEKNNNIKYRYAIYLFVGVVVVALSVRTIFRNIDWKNEDNLWIATAKTSPSGPNIHNNLGDVYTRHGDLPKAAEEFQKAIKINPNYADAYHNLANTYESMGKNDDAIANYQKALKINPRLWQSYQQLAAIYFNNGDYQKSLDLTKKALEINPSDPGLNNNLKLIESKLTN